ncbi:MAG: NlpC/P60 family protein [Humibacillus sp.]
MSPRSPASTTAPPSTPPTHVVRVPVTTLWVDPSSPRPVDAPIVADEPDAQGWLAALDRAGVATRATDGRLGLHGLVESQLLAGEPVMVTALDGGWARIVAPWQLSPKDQHGYPGWVPAAHLDPWPADAPHGVRPSASPAATRAAAPVDDEHPAVVMARRHIGLPYLWCGISPLGYDCSGLVLHLWRQLGHVVARDAYAQAALAAPVALGTERSGDLYFFARSGRRIHHVGIVVNPGRMVHASETGGTLVEEDLPAARLETLVAAGRLPGP